MVERHELFMAEALVEARAALEEGACPIGSIVVLGDEVTARARWHGAGTGLLLRHPELVALEEAERHGIGRRRSEAELYTTLEPCLMCMGAAMSFFAATVVYALASPTDGAAGVAERERGRLAAGAVQPARVPQLVGGVREEEARELMRAFVESGDDAERRWARTLL